MPYITSIERLAMADGEKRGLALGEKRGLELGEKRGLELGEKRGLAKGRADAILDVLSARFDHVPRVVQTEVRRIQDADRLRSLLQRAVKARSLDAFQAALKPANGR